MAPLTTLREFFSFYVDNFDSFKVVAATDRGVYEGRASEAQLGLGQSLGGEIRWSSLGAEQLRHEGLVGWCPAAHVEPWRAQRVPGGFILGGKSQALGPILQAPRLFVRPATPGHDKFAGQCRV